MSQLLWLHQESKQTVFCDLFAFLCGFSAGSENDICAMSQIPTFQKVTMKFSSQAGAPVPGAMSPPGTCKQGHHVDMKNCNHHKKETITSFVIIAKKFEKMFGHFKPFFQ